MRNTKACVKRQSQREAEPAPFCGKSARRQSQRRDCTEFPSQGKVREVECVCRGGGPTSAASVLAGMGRVVGPKLALASKL